MFPLPTLYESGTRTTLNLFTIGVIVVLHLVVLGALIYNLDLSSRRGRITSIRRISAENHLRTNPFPLREVVIRS